LFFFIVRFSKVTAHGQLSGDVCGGVILSQPFNINGASQRAGLSHRYMYFAREIASRLLILARVEFNDEKKRFVGIYFSQIYQSK